MKQRSYIVIILFLVACKLACALTISEQQAQQIGAKIWKNECGGTIDGLTTWNQGEDFASLGIGHFIWYPQGKTGVFKETFPSLLIFLEKHGKKIPTGILKNKSMACPWNSRADFLRNKNSKSMAVLRNFLADTIELQTTFLMQRVTKALPIMLKNLSQGKQTHITQQFNRLVNSSHGLYPLVDYINFKGEGIMCHEQYKGYRWGLLQVLEKMKGTALGRPAIQEFSKAAKEVLGGRVAHAPPTLNEGRWLPGWKNRIDTYLKE